jgi:hypothetical protein
MRLLNGMWKDWRAAAATMAVVGALVTPWSRPGPKTVCGRRLLDETP